MQNNNPFKLQRLRHFTLNPNGYRMTTMMTMRGKTFCKEEKSGLGNSSGVILSLFQVGVNNPDSFHTCFWFLQYLNRQWSSRAGDLVIWWPLCSENFNFFIKMKGMWAEPVEVQLTWWLGDLAYNRHSHLGRRSSRADLSQKSFTQIHQEYRVQAKSTFESKKAFHSNPAGAEGAHLNQKLLLDYRVQGKEKRRERPLFFFFWGVPFFFAVSQERAMLHAEQ